MNPTPTDHGVVRGVALPLRWRLRMTPPANKSPADANSTRCCQPTFCSSGFIVRASSGVSLPKFSPRLLHVERAVVLLEASLLRQVLRHELELELAAHLFRAVDADAR